MTGELESAQDEQPDQVAQVKTIRRGIEADVERDGGRAGGEQPFQLLAIGHVGDQSAPLEILENGGRRHGRGIQRLKRGFDKANLRYGGGD
jgi:hypothetical protein